MNKAGIISTLVIIGVIISLLGVPLFQKLDNFNSDIKNKEKYTITSLLKKRNSSLTYDSTLSTDFYNYSSYYCASTGNTYYMNLSFIYDYGNKISTVRYYRSDEIKQVENFDFANDNLITDDFNIHNWNITGNKEINYYLYINDLTYNNNNNTYTVNFTYKQEVFKTEKIYKNDETEFLKIIPVLVASIILIVIVLLFIKTIK